MLLGVFKSGCFNAAELLFMSHGEIGDNGQDLGKGEKFFGIFFFSLVY